jgi:serine/threonine protein kinase
LEAHAVLQDHPELAADKSAVLDLAYEEFSQRAARGEALDPDLFAARFPDFRHSLRRMLKWHTVLSHNASALRRCATAEIRWPRSGDRFLGFELLEELGRGAFSRVFLANEEAVGHRQVVLKVCLRGDLEAATLGKLDHPHIMPIYSVATDDGSGLTAICMPYLSRTTLQDVLDVVASRPAPPKSWRTILDAIRQRNGATKSPAGWDWPDSYVNGVIQIMEQIADALSHAHRAGFLHCDLKPSNILITSDGDGLLLDFNLAHRLGNDLSIGGTLPFMAPEQLRHIVSASCEPPQASAATDLFSLGATVYQLLSGIHAFGDPIRGSQQEMARCLLEKQAASVRPLRLKNRYVDAKLAELVEGCLKYLPAHRPPSAESLAQSLRESLRLPRRVRRSMLLHRRAWFACGGAGILASAAGIYNLATLPPYSIRQMRRGREALLQGKWERAEQAFTNLLQHEPESIDALIGRSLAHLGDNHAREAHADLLTALKRAPSGFIAALCAYALVIRADAEESPNLIRPAIAYYEDALRQGYSTAATYNNLAYCYLVQPKTSGRDLAAKALEKAFRQDPDEPRVLVNTIVLYRLKAHQSKSAPTVAGFETARFLASDCPCVHREAAYFYAVVASRFPSHERLAAWVDLAARHFQECARFGVLSEDFVSRLTKLVPSLKEDPCLQGVRLDPQPRELALTDRLISPLPEAVQAFVNGAP